MTFPLTALITEHRELGLVVAVLLGFAFGFVLERAGFGRAPKLAAQFYSRDLTVLKVMFGAIVTAMLGLMIAGGVGLVSLAEISRSIASPTYLWPMLVGGLLLGFGFIISGYCPGTSLVATASGNLDGAATIGGVVIGSLLFAEVAEAVPAVAAFHVSGDLGPLFLYEVMGIPAPVLALGVTMMAVGAFLGADKLERLMARRDAAAAATEEEGTEADPEPAVPRRPRRYVFASLAAAAVLAVAALALPRAPQAAAPRQAATITPAELARRIVDQPWTLRILDLRDRAACVKQRVPGAECAPAAELGKLGLAYAAGARDLVIVGAGGLKEAPAPARHYPGKLLLLEGGFQAWREYALTEPPALPATAGTAAREAYAFRRSVYQMLTNRKAPPPPPPAAGGAVPRPKKKKGGGCG